MIHDFCEHREIEKINELMFRCVYPLTLEARRSLNCYPAYIRHDYPKNDSLLFERRIDNRKYKEI